ncbi:putative viral A-type inclusion protein [Sulfurihydrogenibium azorense Az-Fu1]|uniref:Putative viral A-type inclusion protein n=1 Tax=Sulfurihydrogenibium azorense (strain DSM 15241 / OCM 825 / Az-Fu1) TaxID=204536 RepID=C1DW21_SULAA|nr:hypothetical protein [Sulfurihydrogenibium azorense]ACN99292.1 putative viral A-type inclusion protein [Sulfurihydrogenibium azorense Az-Fu1]
MNSIKESSINSSLIETKSIKGKQKPKTSIFDLILSKEFISKESLKSEKSAVDGKNLIDLDKKFRTKSEKNDKTLDNTSLPQIDFNSFEVSKNLELTKKALIKNILKIDNDKKSLTSNNVSLKNEIKTFQEKNKPQKILSQQEVKEPKHSELLNQVKVSEEPKTKKTLPQQAPKLTLSQLENQLDIKSNKSQKQTTELNENLKIPQNTSLKRENNKGKNISEIQKDITQTGRKDTSNDKFLDIKTESKNQNFNKLQNLEREDLVNNLNVNFSIENFKTIEKQDSNNNFNNKIIDQNTTKNNNFDSINGNNLTAINYDITSGYNSSKSSSDNQNNFTQNQSHTFQQNSFQNFNLTYQNTTINAIITQTTLNLFIKTSDIVFTPQMIDSIKNILETNGYKDLKLTLKDREKVYKLNSVEKNTQPITEKGINIAV